MNVFVHTPHNQESATTILAAPGVQIITCSYPLRKTEQLQLLNNSLHSLIHTQIKGIYVNSDSTVGILKLPLQFLHSGDIGTGNKVCYIVPDHMHSPHTQKTVATTRKLHPSQGFSHCCFDPHRYSIWYVCT